MKRKYILNFLRIISIILCMNYTNYSFAFLWENLGLDLYSKIDEWIVELEDKNYEHTMKGESWKNYTEINRILKAEWLWECLDSELSLEDIKKISKWIYKDLDSKISDECLDEKWNITTDKLNQIQSVISRIDYKYSESAENKTKQIFQISNIWIYSDWILENSWFDLISDLEEINKIIFSNEIKYVWEDISWQDNAFSNFIKNTKSKASKLPSGWYKWVNDNSSWWCNDQIFCVKEKFKMYNSEALWSWDNSIEWILKRSNEHFKKFAWSFLWQASMTSWMFECSICRNLDLWEMFHVWFQIESRPFSILKLEKENSNNQEWNSDNSSNNEKWNDKDKESFFSYKNLLNESYKNHWLDYERANDLTIYRREIQKKKSLLDSAELTPSEVSKNEQNRVSYKEGSNGDFVTTSVNKKVLSDDTQDFYNQFLELETHTNTILDYTDSIKSVIDEMKKTPVHN